MAFFMPHRHTMPLLFQSLASSVPAIRGFLSHILLAGSLFAFLGQRLCLRVGNPFLRSLYCTAPQLSSSFFLLSFSSYPRAAEVCAVSMPLLIYRLPPYWKLGSRTDMTMPCSMLIGYLWIIQMSHAWDKKGELRNKKLGEQIPFLLSLRLREDINFFISSSSSSSSPLRLAYTEVLFSFVIF